MGVLSTSGGSSVVARELGTKLPRYGYATRYIHLDENAQHAEADILLDPAPGQAVAELLDVPIALAGGNDAAGGLLRAYDAWPFDLLHVHNLQVFGQPAMILEALRAVPYVVTCHGSDILNERLMDRNREILSLVLRRAKAVTCVSAHLAEALRRKLPELAKVHVIHNFLRDGWRAGHTVRETPPPPRLLHVSSLRDVKRPELLLRVFSKLRRRRPDARLSIVTTPAGRKRLEALIGITPEHLGIDAFDGESDPAALHREAARSGAFLLTSRFEGFGLVVLEALAYGLPVIAPRVGALAEVLGEDWPLLVKDGCEDELVEACVRSLSDGACDTGRMSEITSRFDGERQVMQYADLYGNVLSGRAMSAS